jgi:hypothetical protein
MSYAGPSTRAVRPSGTDPDGGGLPRPITPGSRSAAWPDPSRPSSRTTVVFAAGVVVGLAVGAGFALLFAPESGAYTRRALVRRGRRVTARGRDAWDDLRDELRDAVRARKRAWRRRRAASKDGQVAE